MNHPKYYRHIGVVIVTPFLLSGCASLGDSSKKVIGCVGGSLLGGVIGYLNTGDARGALVGGVAGTMIGCGIGSYLDEREEKLKKLAEESALKPEFERIVLDDKTGADFSENATEDVIASQVSLVTDQPLFASGKAEIEDQNSLKNLQFFLKGYVDSLATGSKIYIVGHTDSSGSSIYNQDLSEKRARFIADQLVTLGANPENILYEGVGESQPVASNDTEDGKARNRRFELIDFFVTDSDKAKRISTVSDEKIVKVASAKKSRIENVKNKTSTTQIAKAKESAAFIGSGIDHRENLDLGGMPIERFDEKYIKTAFGEVKGEYEYTFFSKAIADSTPLLGSCAYTEPVVQSYLKSYTGREISSSKVKVSESPKNLYGTTWFGMANKTGVTLGPIGMREDTLEPTYNPILSFYKNYDGSAEKPDYEYPVSIETYRGDNSVLVRMYAKDDDAIIKCSDVVYSLNGEAVTKANAVIYQKDNKLMVKTFEFRLVKG